MKGNKAFSAAGLAECRQQYFRVRPQDIEVAEGGTAVIACEVGNREGRVQWTKDGLTLGKESSFLGELGRGEDSNARLCDCVATSPYIRYPLLLLGDIKRLAGTGKKLQYSGKRFCKAKYS